MTRTVFKCIDAHTCGNPVRVVSSSKPELVGASMSERRQHFVNEFDWIRTGLMFEPRGHDAMSGTIIYLPIEAESDLAVLYIEVSGCLPMCGHGTIGTVTIAIEENLVEPKTPGLLNLDTPAGLVQARYQMDGAYVESVELTNIPSFLFESGIDVEVPGMGRLTLDVSYGGNFYAIVEPQANYRGLDHLSVDQIRTFSPLVRNAVNQVLQVVHPQDQTISGVSHVMWTDSARHADADLRNAVFYGDRGVDRSPCGTGTSARVAQLASRGELKIGEKFVHESIIGSLFTGCAIEVAQVGDYSAIVPTISGWAQVTGYNDIIIDDRDPYAKGFLLN